MGTNTVKTPAERKAAARAEIVGTRDPECDCEFCKQLNTYASAYVDEAVAPALELIHVTLQLRLDAMGLHQTLEEIRKLLTERAGT
jgi:hypothetical protein